MSNYTFHKETQNDRRNLQLSNKITSDIQNLKKKHYLDSSFPFTESFTDGSDCVKNPISYFQEC
jgi:hypothetical protein